MRERGLVFWTLAFPIILGTLFYFSFGGLEASGFTPAKVVVINESQENTDFVNIVDKLDGELIRSIKLDESEAMSQLLEGKIDGIYYIDKDISLNIAFNNLQTSVLSSILNEYEDQTQVIGKVSMEHPQLVESVVGTLMESKEHVTMATLGGTPISGNSQYFYALIAMASLYGSFLGLNTIIILQANQSPLATRRGIAPVNKMKLLGTEMTVDFGIHFINMVIVIGYIKYILKVSLGDEIGYLLLICLVGSIGGVAFGMLIGVMNKLDANGKTGLCIIGSLICSFLAGLMYSRIKINVEHYAPIINRINPAALISDACYSLTVYDNMSRYALDLGMVFIESVICLFICFFKVRGERYDSI